MGVATARLARPPRVRGGTAPLPASTLTAGALSLGAALGGTLIVQIAYAIAGGPVTRQCLSQGLDPKDVKGALGVCHIVEAIRSTPQTIILVAAVVAGVAAIAAGFSTYKRMPTKRMREQAITGAVLGLQGVALAAFLLWFREGDITVFVRNFFNFVLLKGHWFGAFVNGAKNTLLLAFVGETGGIVIGLILAIFTLSTRRAVRAPARTYINFFRGTPLIWQLGFFYFGLSLGLNLDLDALQTAFIVFSLNTGAYAAEVFRAGIQSIERGQMEAARSVGMSYLQAMRYAIVPQAVRRVIPPLMNEFVILIKDTALIIVLGLLESQYELYTTAREGYAETFNATFFIAAAIGYLVITLPLIRAVNVVEHRLRSGLTGVVGI